MNTFRAQVAEFKHQLIEQALARHRGNRTYAAAALGLQRTYLLRLMRDMKIEVITSRHSPGTRKGSAQ